MSGTVYVIDDDAAVRDSLALLVRSVGLESRTFASATEFLGAFDSGMDGCLVVDIRMPGMSGLDLQQALNERGCRLPLLFITGHGDVAMAVRAMRAGALDFIEKPFRDQELLDRINQALTLSAQQRSTLAEVAEIRARIATLTPREREIMDRIVAGQANKVIAVELGLSERTVEIHRAKVMSKTRVHSLAELVTLVARAR
ncbi:MAG: hypothetical protein RL434_1111 [Pseudomonadota bacterium]|jgi:FixJ family two-component response regulator